MPHPRAAAAPPAWSGQGALHGWAQGRALVPGQIGQRGLAWPVALGTGLATQRAPLPSSAGTRLQSRLIPFGERAARERLPGFLLEGASPVADLIHNFGAPGEDTGSGLHLGGGYVLTARHVGNLYLPGDAPRPTRAFVGSAETNVPGWTIRVAPAVGSYAGTGRQITIPDRAIGKWNDWMILHVPGASPTRAASPVFRRTSTMAPGERVWVVGNADHHGNKITVGTLRELRGVNAVIADTRVKGGLSGSPAFDDHGNVIGLIFGSIHGGTGAYMMTSDAILDGMAAARRKDPSLPTLREAS